MGGGDGGAWMWACGATMPFRFCARREKIDEKEAVRREERKSAA